MLTRSTYSNTLLAIAGLTVRYGPKFQVMTKRLFIFSIILPLMLASGCTKLQPHLNSGKGDSYPEPGEHPISISCPLVSPSTKALAGEMPLNYSTDESFGVYALYYPTGNFNGWESTTGSTIYIDGAEFSYKSSINDATEGSGAWSADYYWPKGGKMTFAAWSPYRAKNDCTISYGPSGLQLTGFTTAEHGSEHYDLLYSERVYDKADCSGTSTQYDGIDLLFSHALSSLHFTACSSVSTANIRISKIVIYDIYKSGDFSENVSETPPYTYSSSPAWTFVGGKAQYTEASPLVVYEDNSGTAAPTLPLPGSGTTLEVGFALPIPQDITSARMKVYYSVQLGSAEPVPTVSQALQLSSGTVTQWKRQTRYTYNLILGAQQIRFSVDVRGWSDSDNTDIQ